MKKCIKIIIGCIIACMTIAPLSIGAYEVGDVITSAKIPLNENGEIDQTSEEFKEFVKIANKTSEYDNEFSNGDWYLIQWNEVGGDGETYKIIADNLGAESKGVDEKNNPIFIATEYSDREIAITYGFDLDLLDPHRKQIISGFDRKMIRINEDGNPEIVDTIQLDIDLYRTKNLHTGEDIIVKRKFIDNKVEFEYSVIGKGDATLDGNVDIRDIAQYAQHIVELSKIPEYADIVADIDADGLIGVKDLVSLKAYIVGNRPNL